MIIKGIKIIFLLKIILLGGKKELYSKIHLFKPQLCMIMIDTFSLLTGLMSDRSNNICKL